MADQTTVRVVNAGFPPCGPVPACGECGLALQDRATTIDAWRLHGFVPHDREHGWFCVACAERIKSTWRTENILELLTRAKVPRRHHAATLASLPADMRRELDRWVKLGEFLVILGPVGSGKSWSVAAVCRELLLAGRNLEWWAAADIITSAKAFDTWDETSKRLRSAEVLVIDDLAAERDTDFALAVLAELVAARWDACLATAATTNLGPSALRAWHPRMASRVLSGIRVELTGRDRRLAGVPGEAP